MRILTSSLICAALLCAAVSIHADDNAAQAAARAALMQKMNDLDSQQGEPAQPPPMEMAPTNPPPMAPPEPTTPPPVEMQPTTLPAEPIAPPPIIPPPVEMQPVVPSPNPPPQMSDQQQAIAEEQALIASKQTNAATIMAPAPMVNVYTNAPQQLVNMEPAAPGAPIAPVPANAKMMKAKPVKSNYGGGFGFAPIQAPPPPVSPEQEAQLQVLLEKYKADQITPDEYQAQRAAIIGVR